MTKAQADDRVVCRNRKARFKFEIMETLECGIALRGSEVKSLREKAASIEEAYARMDGGELWLVGSHIAPYVHAPTESQDPYRKRKLLLHRAELRKLLPKTEQKGLTIVPLQIHFSERGVAKVLIGLARGKTLSDKRETMKAREHKREMDRATRSRKR
jgi:SsrA-binding protein